MKHPTYDLIVQLINSTFNKKKLNIIDYGCGSGNILNFIRPELINKYLGYDVNQNSIIAAKKQWTSSKVSFFYINNQKNIFNNIKNIDLIVTIGVLQYMKDDDLILFLKQTKTILNKKGIIIISCLSDHKIYRTLDFNQLFFTYRYLKRQGLTASLKHAGFSILEQKEKGILFSFLSWQLSIFFDSLDKLFFKCKGTIGPVGKLFRRLSYPINKLEYYLPFDFGYTLFIKAQPV